MTATTPVEEQQVRRGFERVAKRHADKAGMDFTRLNDGHYKYLRLEFMWQGWLLAHEWAKANMPAAEDVVPKHHWYTHPYEPDIDPLD